MSVSFWNVTSLNPGYDRAFEQGRTVALCECTAHADVQRANAEFPVKGRAKTEAESESKDA